MQSPVQFWPENPEYPVCGSEDCNPVPVLIVSALKKSQFHFSIGFLLTHQKECSIKEYSKIINTAGSETYDQFFCINQ